MSGSADEKVKQCFIDCVLQFDSGPWEAVLSLELEQRAGTSEIEDRLIRVTQAERFYFWFCEATECITGRPKLPLRIGRMFSHSEAQVRQYIHSACRKLGWS
jgi:hypothetical protein